VVVSRSIDTLLDDLRIVVTAGVNLAAPNHHRLVSSARTGAITRRCHHLLTGRGLWTDRTAWHIKQPHPEEFRDGARKGEEIRETAENRKDPLRTHRFHNAASPKISKEKHEQRLQAL
jgi:hypothetical protein